MKQNSNDESATAPGDRTTASDGQAGAGRIRKAGAALFLVVFTAIVTYYAPGVFNRIGHPTPTAPLSIQVLSKPGEFGHSSPYDDWWLFPRGRPLPNDLPAGVTHGMNDNFDFWALAEGAIPAHHLEMEIVVRGTSDSPVIINGLRIVITQRSNPIPGWYSTGIACGGQTVRQAYVDLDATPPRISYWPDPGQTDLPNQKPSRSLTLRVTRDDIEILDIFAVTDKYAVSWYADLLYDTANKAGTFRIDDHGKPFQQTAVVKGSSHAYRKVYPFRLVRDAQNDGVTSAC